MRLGWSTCAAAIAACGCTHPGIMVPDPSLATDDAMENPPSVAQLGQQVARLRGLRIREAIPVKHLDESAFMHDLDRGARRGPSLGPAFGLLPSDEREGHRAPDVLPTLVEGFYDEHQKAISLRRQDLPDAAHMLILAHEVEHALQDQNGLLTLARQRGRVTLEPHDGRFETDAALAFRALGEGDADVTGLLYVAEVRAGMGHLFRRVLGKLREQSIETTLVDQDDEADGRFARRVFSFPYVMGTAFVGDVYRTGGFAMVNRLFESPPASTAQILHPEKYLRGELPVTVPIPSAPEGMQRIAGGTMGELRTRAFLAACPGPRGGEPLGWGGDALATVTDGAGVRGVLWSTVWDDAAAAEGFESRVRDTEACVRRTAGASHAADPPATVLRSADRVAYVQGLPAERSEAIARELLDATVERPPPAAAPLGDASFPPWIDADTLTYHGRVQGDSYVSDALGLTVPIKSFDVKPGGEITLERWVGDSHVFLRLDVLLDAWTPPLEARFASDFVAPHRRAGRPVVFDGLQSLAIHGSAARILTWTLGPYGNLRLIALPVCHGKITLVVGSLDGGTIGWDIETELLRRIRVRDDSPACRFVSQTTSNG